MDLIFAMITSLFSLGVLIIGYFLRRTMDELGDIKEVATRAKEKVDLLEVDYLNKIDRMNEKIDLLNKSLDKLVDKIEKLVQSL